MLSSAQEPTSSPNAGGMSDEELVERFRSGDKASFEILFDRYNLQICAYCVHLTGDEVGYDLAGQTFVNVYRSLGKLQTGKAFKSWVYSIAINLVRDHLRRKKLLRWLPWREVQEEQIIDTHYSGTFGQQPLEQEVQDREFIQQVMQHVSNRYRRCTYLAIFCGMRAPEIAETLDIPERTARRHVEKGIKELGNIYNKLVDICGALEIKEYNT